LKILLTDATKIFAGGEEYVYTLARHLQMRGHKVLVSGNPNHLLLRKCERSGITTAPVEYGKQAKMFAVAQTLRQMIRSLSIDIIHSNANYDRTTAAIAALFTPAKHIASVHSAHSIQFNLTHWLRNRFAVARFIAVAEVVKDILVREDGIDSSMVTCIPNGVEDTTESFRRETRVRIRAEWNITPQTVVIGNVARLVPFKGHEYLLQSIALVVATSPNVFFPVLGDGELLSELEQQARALGIEDHVRFLGFRENVNELYPAFDIYCHSSVERAEEAFPLAVLHALAAGLPVVSTNVGGISSMVEHETTGFLTPPEQPKALADALLLLMKNSELRRTMGKASLKSFLTRFSASLMAERVEQIYSDALIH
jgi:glycosyltransferase involved in cell wall biosynthesis